MTDYRSTLPTYRDQRDERSLGELFSELSQNFSLLVRQEVALAKTEMSEKLAVATKDIAALAVGGVLAFVGLMALVAAVILLLTQVVGIVAWLSALIVGLLLAGVGAFMLQRGLGDLKKLDLTPRRTAATLRHDVQWAKEQAR